MSTTQSIDKAMKHSKLEAFSLGFEVNRTLKEERQHLKARTHKQ